MLFGELNLLWKHINQKLLLIDEILAIGFSFRDEHFNQLLIETSLKREKPHKINIVIRNKQYYDLIIRKLSGGNFTFNRLNGWMSDIEQVL